MTLYWVYDIPNWLFATLCIAAFTSFGLVGVAVSRRFVRRLHRKDHSHNDIVGYYLAAVTVFYGITLGLVAIGTWTTYSDVETKVDREAQVIGALYRDAQIYPEPQRTTLKRDIKAYTRQIIDVSWPAQRRGTVPNGAGELLDLVQHDLETFEPTTNGQQILHAEAYRQFNMLVESRRSRLNSVTASIPTSLWTLVILGALISIAVTIFFDTASLPMHLWMTGLMSALLGLLIFLVGTLDNPFRGKVSVSPAPLERVYQQVMK